MQSVAAVTGSTGFIGLHLCSRLRDRGWQVRAIARPGSPKPLPEGVSRLESPLERAALTEAFRGANVVFHLAGQTRAASLKGFMPVNVEAAEGAALAARDVGARFVHVSSLAAAGTGTTQRPRIEDDVEEPVSDYGSSKLASENRIRSIEGLRWTILRPSPVYGPGDRDFEILFRLASKGFFPVLGSSEQAYSFLYIDDLVHAMETVAHAEGVESETFFVAHPEIVTLARIMKALGRVYGRRLRQVKVPVSGLWLLMNLARPAAFFGLHLLLTPSRYQEISAGDFICSPSKLKEVVGFEARMGLEGGFERAGEWYGEKSAKGPD